MAPLRPAPSGSAYRPRQMSADGDDDNGQQERDQEDGYDERSVSSARRMRLAVADGQRDPDRHAAGAEQDGDKVETVQ